MLKCLLIKLYEYLDFLLNASEKKRGWEEGRHSLSKNSRILIIAEAE